MEYGVSRSINSSATPHFFPVVFRPKEVCMWQLIGKPVVKQVSETLAKQFKEMPPVPHDRELREYRLVAYRGMCEEGSFRTAVWATCECAETGLIYRVNGKHTSHVFHDLAVEGKLPELFVTVEHYQCDTLDDVARLYATFDAKMSMRSPSDINRAFAATVPELVSFGTRLINLAVTGMAYYHWEDQYASTTHPPVERAELLLEFPGFIVWASKVLGGSCGGRNSRLHLWRGPVVGAMFATWKKAQKDAMLFWEAVRDETGDHPTTPDRKLAKFLSTHAVSGKLTHRYTSAPSRAFFVKSIIAWNAWRDSKPTELKYHPSAPTPKCK